MLFLMPQMGLGGSERLVHSLALRLDRSRFNPSVAWLYGDEALREFKELEVPLHHVPKAKRIDVGTMRALAEIARAESIDVVNAQHFMPAVYAYYACHVAARRPLVFTAHSRWELEETPLKWRVAGGYLLKRIGASVGVSADVSAALQGVFRLEASRIVTIENGVDLDAFSRAADHRGLRSSLGLAEGDRVIGMVANLKTVKNHLFLLQAFAAVARDMANVRLLLVGQGFAGESDNTEGTLRQFVDDRGLGDRVLFLGYRTDVASLLQVMDVFCLTSLREGLPIGVIEAMAAGLPVIGTNVPGVRDVVSPGEDGLLVELDDVTALRDTLIGLLGDEERRRKLGQSGHRKAIAKYSLQRCVREYEALFTSLAQR